MFVYACHSQATIAETLEYAGSSAEKLCQHNIIHSPSTASVQLVMKPHVYLRVVQELVECLHVYSLGACSCWVLVLENSYR